MATIAFVYRHSTKLGKHPGTLVLRIIHKRKVKKITTEYNIYPDEWNAKEGVLIFPLNDLNRKAYLMQTEGMMKRDISLFRQVIETLELQGEYTIEDIVLNYNMYGKMDMLTNYVHKLSVELHASGRERTARAYNTAVNRFIAFNNGKDLHIEYMNSHMVKAFEHYLMCHGKSPNTISFYMRNLRAIYNKAIEDIRLESKENPFRSVYTGIRATKKKALFKDDLSNLYSINLDTIIKTPEYDKLLEAKQLFFFCFHARGMSFVDMAYLRKENIKKGIIYYYRKKTGKLIEVKITSEMKSIMEYFAPQVEDSPYVFPIIKNTNKSPRLQYESALRVQNKRLKKLAYIANIGQVLTTHVARHSWATIAKHVNLPLWIISEGLGHSDEKTTYTYLASFERSVLDRANEQIHTAIQSDAKRLHHKEK